jgi:endo-1,4-beta-xylanase
MNNLFRSKQEGITAIFVIIFLVVFSCKPKSGNNEDVTNNTLKDAFKDIFYFGTALNKDQIQKKDTNAYDIMVEQFNAITAENVMKWEKIHPQPGKYDFELSDEFVKLGEENNMYIVGHVLIWHSQTPDWVFYNENGSKVSRDTLLERMRDHIYTVVGRYKGRVNCWDVVNEAIDDNGGFRDNIWAQIIGKDYVQKAFEFAHEADPEAILIYNDYSLPTPVKREGVVKLIKELQDNGVKVDGIGMQGHYHLDYPLLEDLEGSIEAFGKLGVNVMITELDINVLPFPEEIKGGADVSLSMEKKKEYDPYVKALPDSMQVKLAHRYADFFRIFVKHKDIVNRVTIWGINDAQSWLNYWPIYRRTNYPLLFDRNYKTKPAYDSIINTGKI